MTHYLAKRPAACNASARLNHCVFFLLLLFPIRVNLGDGGLQLVLVLELLEHGRVHALPQRLGQERDHLHTAHPSNNTGGTQGRQALGRIRESSGCGLEGQKGERPYRLQA